MVSARLDRLPATGYVWGLIILLSLGGFFELYDIYLTASISPGLIRELLRFGETRFCLALVRSFEAMFVSVANQNENSPHITKEFP
jgi:hypothetical protein